MHGFSDRWTAKLNAAAGPMSSGLLLLSGAVCAARFAHAAQSERALSAAVCGDGLAGHAFALGQCSHCWALAAGAFTLAAAGMVLRAPAKA